MTKKSTGRERENPLRAIGDITEHKRAEEALRESEEQWRSLVENIPDIIMTLDRDGTILFINRTPPGFTVEATIGVIVYDYVPPEHHDTLRKSLEGVFEAGDAHGFEIAGAGPFGRTSWYFNRIGPVVRDGRVVAATLIATDITEQRRAEEALRKRTRDLDERVKELNCLHGISKLVDEPDISLQEIVQGTVDLIPASWQYPEVTCARIILQGQEFRTKNFNEAPWRQTADITVRGQPVGTLDVGYLEERPERDEGPFLKEERSLINAIAGRLGRITDRKQDQEAVSRQAEVNSSIAEVSRALIESRPIDDFSDVVLECA